MRWRLLGFAVLVACPSRGPAPELEAIEPVVAASSTTGAEELPVEREPVAVVASESCEQVCGQTYECLLAETAPVAESLAANLELQCLGSCVEGGGGVGKSRFADCLGPGDCAELLTCMRAAWPLVAAPDPVIEPTPSEGGCRLGCSHIGRCHAGTVAAIDQCTVGCERGLDAEQQRAFGECTQMSDCIAMLECMIAFPGA